MKLNQYLLKKQSFLYYVLGALKKTFTAITKEKILKSIVFHIRAS